MSLNNSIRLLIADDYVIVREGLKSIINGEANMTVVAEARNGQEAIEAFREHQPDVTLMDLRMPVMSGHDAITTIRKEFPRARIIVLTRSGTDEDIYRSLRSGVQSFLWKSVSRAKLLEAIRIVHSGGRLITRPVASRLAARVPESELTPRQVEVLELIFNGKSNKRVASALRISEGTVKGHVVNIMGKLGADDRTQAAIKALRRGIIHFD